VPSAAKAAVAVRVRAAVRSVLGFIWMILLCGAGLPNFGCVG
jgi:hypothetical protein